MFRLTILYVLLAQVADCASQQQMKVLVESDTSLEIRTGGSFAVELPSAAGTGYRWELAAAPEAALLVLEKKEHRPDAKNADGSNGLDHFEFKTQGVGAADLNFQLVRPWKQDKTEDPNARRKRYAIKIID